MNKKTQKNSHARVPPYIVFFLLHLPQSLQILLIFSKIPYFSLPLCFHFASTTRITFFVEIVEAKRSSPPQENNLKFNNIPPSMEAMEAKNKFAIIRIVRAYARGKEVQHANSSTSFFSKEIHTPSATYPESSTFSVARRKFYFPRRKFYFPRRFLYFPHKNISFPSYIPPASAPFLLDPLCKSIYHRHYAHLAQ